MEINKKIIIPVGLGLIVVLVIVLAIGGKSIKNSEKKVPAQVQSNQPVTEATEPPAITETTTDAMTGAVMDLSAGSITLKDETGEKKFELKGKVDTFSIDKEKGIVVRDFSEVKKGINVTVNFIVQTNVGTYIVLEQ